MLFMYVLVVLPAIAATRAASLTHDDDSGENTKQLYFPVL
jgi:hypothetical protein